MCVRLYCIRRCAAGPPAVAIDAEDSQCAAAHQWCWWRDRRERPGAGGAARQAPRPAGGPCWVPRARSVSRWQRQVATACSSRQPLATMGKGRDNKKKAAKKAGKVVAGKGQAKTDSKTKKNDKKKTRRELFSSGVGGEEVRLLLAL